MSDAGAARAFAGAFLLVGVLGFVPGATTHYGDLHFAGHSSHAQLLGVFRVSILLNDVHLLIGVIGLVTGRAGDLVLAALGLWLLGVLSAGHWLPLDTADNWLHFTLGVGLLGAGSLARRTAPRASTA